MILTDTCGLFILNKCYMW